jgi:rhamnulose-1-phosphate aldolase
MSTAPFLAEIVKTSSDMWFKGWAEANAGNISVRLAHEMVDNEPSFSHGGAWTELPEQLPEVAGDTYVVTGTGRFLRNIEISAENNLGVIEINDRGSAYRALWGFKPMGKPTSELLPHLKVHAIRKSVSENMDRAVIHTHSPNLIALTGALDLNTVSLTRLLWEIHAECIVAFPEGIEFLPWELPGSTELANATAHAARSRRVVVWQLHGVLAVGRSLDAAFGLIDTVEKAASIYLKAMQAGGLRHKLSTAQLEALAKKFNVRPDPLILHA